MPPQNPGFSSMEVASTDLESATHCTTTQKPEWGGTCAPRPRLVGGAILAGCAAVVAIVAVKTLGRGSDEQVKPSQHGQPKQCAFVPELVADRGALSGVDSPAHQDVNVTDEHLIGYWRFDDPLGTRHWRDSSARGSPLVSVRPSHQHPFAEALGGAGLGGSGALRTWGRSCARAVVPCARTLAFWAKRDAGCCERIEGWAKLSVGEVTVLSMRVFSGKLIASACALDGIDCASAQIVYLDSESGEEWNHIAATVEADRLNLYLDGELKHSVQHSITDLQCSDATLQFGTGGPQHPFLGVADELRIYSIALSADDVARLAATEGTKGIMEGENVPPIADAGPTLTVWAPQASATLAGSCIDEDSEVTSGLAACWQVVSGPDASAVAIADPTLASTEVSLGSALAGEYKLRLTCTDGELHRAADLTLVVFEAHESKVGATVETRGEPVHGFPGAGAPAKPVALWLFDGDLESAADGGQAATVAKVKGNGEATFEESGRFGGALGLHCGDDYCVQLDLGNPEKSGPWQAVSVSLWYNTAKPKKLKFASKGSFGMDDMSDTGDMSWHHYVVTRSADIQKGYLDGKLLFLTSGAEARGEADADAELLFGIDSGHPSYGFDGLVDEIAVFDFVLSNEEVEILFIRSAASFTARGNMNPLWRGGYNATGLEFFPDLPEVPDYTSYVGGSGPSATSPAAYVHPRIFFTPDELPALRRRLRDSTAGRVAMENVRGLLREGWTSSWPWWRTERLASIHDDDFGNLDQQLIFESFRALIDGDGSAAARVGEQLDVMAEEMQESLSTKLHEFWAKPWKMGFTARDSSNTWQEIGQPTLKRGTTMAFCYDFLYPWLPEGTRQKVRRAIATATQGTWSIGMDSLEAYPSMVSNWQSWVTGDLILTLLAIEGEDGFDKGVYASAAKSWRGWSTLGVSAVSGATYEGGGKNSIAGPKYLALAKHGYPQYIAMPGPKKFGEKFLLHTMLPNGLFFADDMWGSIEWQPKLGDVAALKYAYPDSKAIDFVYRNAAERAGASGDSPPYGNFRPSRAVTSTYNNFLTDMIYATDWTGPAEWSEHASFATATEPLTYVAEDHGLLVARSSWSDKDAAWLLFNVRSLPGGHAAPSRGQFCFHAIGETWAFYATGHNQEHSSQHSVILVDGQGQQAVPGKFVQYRDSAEATFGTADARHAYGVEAFGGGYGGQAVNAYMVKPGPYKWEGLTWAELPGWYHGNSPELDKGRQINSQPPGTFPKAFRTVGLVRNPDQAYALVLDDIQKDDQKHDFAWRMVLRQSYSRFDLGSGQGVSEQVNRDYFRADGNDFILKDGRGGEGRLLVRLLEGSSKRTSAGIVDAGTEALQVVANEVSARFRILLYPLKDAISPLPETSWDEGSSTLTVNGDDIKLTVTDDGATVVESLKVAGGQVSLTTNEVFDG